MNRINSNAQELAMSLKLKTIINADVYSESEEEAKYFQKRRTTDLMYKSNGDKSHPYDKSVSFHELRNGSNSFTYNTMSEEFQAEIDDFEIMNCCLRNSTSPIKKFDILQSLLLKLANQETLERHATIQAIIDNDLFSVKRKIGRDIIIKNLLWPLNVRTPHPLQTSTAKLLNALVSYQIGREYFNQISMVNLLTWSDSEIISESMKDHLMAVMMKLSLSQFHRCDMLKKGLINWLINHMEKVEFTATKFHLECMTDLLRVLMDVENATEFSSVKIPQLIIVLVRYMNVENEYVKMNVCHALRALFKNSTAIRIGNKLHLHRIIQDHIQRTSNSKLKEDLKFIYRLFMNYRMYESSKHGRSAAISDNRAINDSHEIDSTSERNKMTVKYHSEPEMHLKTDAESLRNVTKNMVSTSENHHSGISRSVQFSEKFKQGLLADISSCILQMCMTIGIENGESSRKRSKIQKSETDDSFESVSTEGENSTSDSTSSSKNNEDQRYLKTLTTPDVIYTNSNWKIDQNSSLLHSNSRIYSKEAIVYARKHTEGKGSNKRVDADMEDVNKNRSTKSASQLEKSKPSNMKPSTKSMDLNSIAKDPILRKDILENDSFIEELCEKVMNKLKTQLFCGPNCNTNKCCEKKPDNAN